MSTLWIVTANKSYAKIFEVKGLGKHIKEIHHFDNPDGHKKSGELYSDRPGRSFDKIGGGRHSLTDDKVDFHEQEQHRFATQLAEVLQEGKDSKAFDTIALVAPTPVLNTLNKVLPSPLKKSVVKEVAKDLPEHLGSQERLDQLCKYLDLWNR